MNSQCEIVVVGGSHMALGHFPSVPSNLIFYEAVVNLLLIDVLTFVVSLVEDRCQTN